MSEKSGQIDPTRNRMVIGKERHDLGRPNDQGYPVRAIRTPEYLYVRNYEPDRWPAGNPETSYPNCDNGPTKTLITSQFDAYYRLCFGKRPAEELYRVDADPDCMKNLADEPSLRALKDQLSSEMESLLRKDEDPRVFGPWCGLRGVQVRGRPRAFLRCLAKVPPVNCGDRLPDPSINRAADVVVAVVEFGDKPGPC